VSTKRLSKSVTEDSSASRVRPAPVTSSTSAWTLVTAGSLGAQSGFERLAHGGGRQDVQHGDPPGREGGERGRHLAGVHVGAAHRLGCIDRRVREQGVLDDRGSML